MDYYGFYIGEEFEAYKYLGAHLNELAVQEGFSGTPCRTTSTPPSQTETA